ncbi:Fic family protein [Jiangella mangrovi]|uniref:Fic family protein n=1 Tax=Jiangella mangrovi TaxID=1524084 RepID=UPI0016102B73
MTLSAKPTCTTGSGRGPVVIDAWRPTSGLHLSRSLRSRTDVDDLRWRWLHTTDLTPRVLGITFHAIVVHIHPFFDGNGRTTRLLADLALRPPRRVMTFLSKTGTSTGGSARNRSPTRHRTGGGRSSGQAGQSHLWTMRMATDSDRGGSRFAPSVLTQRHPNSCLDHHHKVSPGCR